MNRFLKVFFGLDLWIALTLMTSMIVSMFFSEDNALMITFCLGFALVNSITCVLTIKSINFYKNKSIKTTN